MRNVRTWGGQKFLLHPSDEPDLTDDEWVLAADTRFGIQVCGADTYAPYFFDGDTSYDLGSRPFCKTWTVAADQIVEAYHAKFWLDHP